MTPRRRLRGLAALGFDGLEHGSRAIERVHVETAGRVFAILEAIAPTRPFAHVVRVAHDTTVAVVHGAVRIAGRALAASTDLAIAAGTRDAPTT